MRRYLRGEIYYANLDPVFGSEQSGFRPVLIIQNDIGNRYSPTVIHYLLFLIFYFKREGGAGLSPCAPYKWVTVW